jgi:hypothetical protein
VCVCLCVCVSVCVCAQFALDGARNNTSAILAHKGAMIWHGDAHSDPEDGWSKMVL